MASFKAKFPVLQELFAKNHRGGPFGPPPPPSGARVKSTVFTKPHPMKRHKMMTPMLRNRDS